jgi:hypothetical protein
MSKKHSPPKQTLGDFLEDPLWNLYFFFEFSEGKYFRYSKEILKVINILQRLSNRINALFNFMGSPLLHLSRYFQTGEGQNLKFAKQARQAIALIQNGKYLIGDFLMAAFKFATNIVIPWLGRAISWLFKVTLITIVTLLSWTSIYVSLWYREVIGQYLEMPVYIQWIALLIFFHTINRLISIIQAEIWYGYHSEGMVEDNYQTNCLLFSMSSVILFALYAITTFL